MTVEEEVILGRVGNDLDTGAIPRSRPLRRVAPDSDEQEFRLFGYAGTGKTTIARHLAALSRRGDAVRCIHRQSCQRHA
jgi:hypothetical protein